MVHQGDIKEHMAIFDKEGSAFGTVDRLEGGTATIKLTRDPASGVHHWIPLAWVKRINKKGMFLDRSSIEAHESWQESPPQLQPTAPVATAPVATAAADTAAS